MRQRGNTLRRELFNIKARLNPKSEMTTVWHEEDLATTAGRPLRRYSGVRDLDELEELHCHKHLVELVNSIGLSPYCATKGLFALPGWLRDVLRGPGCDIDQRASHLMAQFARHPGKPMLRKYLSDVDAAHALVAAPSKEVKRLFRGFLYTGGAPHVNEWCQEVGVAADSLPQFVWDFMKEQRVILKEDAAANLELLDRLRKAGYERPEVQLQVLQFRATVIFVIPAAPYNTK